jgi:hypothetical protein
VKRLAVAGFTLEHFLAEVTFGCLAKSIHLAEEIQ